MDPWSKVDYSRHIREASMAMEKLPKENPPSGRVPGQGLLAPPILKRRQRWNKEGFWKKGSALRVFVVGGKYRLRGQLGGHQEFQAPPGRLGPWWVPSSPHLVIPEASVALILYIFFMEF